MRCQAEHWDKALELAVALDPAQVGQLSCLQAQVHRSRVCDKPDQLACRLAAPVCSRADWGMTCTLHPSKRMNDRSHTCW